MRLLTLNTHSLVAPDYEAKRKFFVDFIAKEQPDVFALQEVNQTASAPAMPIPLADYCPCSGNGILLKEDNHAAAVAQMLKEEGVHYYWSWLPAKIGYDKYDEGQTIIITGKRVVHLVSVQEMSGTMRYTWAGGRMKKSLFSISGKRCPVQQPENRWHFCWVISTVKQRFGEKVMI